MQLENCKDYKTSTGSHEKSMPQIEPSESLSDISSTINISELLVPLLLIDNKNTSPCAQSYCTMRRMTNDHRA